MEGPVRSGQVVLAALAYVPFLNMVPLLVVRFRRPQPRFVTYHTIQGLYMFSVFVVVITVLLGFFYVFDRVLQVGIVRQVLAVVVVMALAAYVIVTPLMIASVLLRRMVMLPVLGELAGER